MKLVAACIIGLGLGMSSTVFAGGNGGCIYGSHDGSLAKSEELTTPPVAANDVDPKWLALQKRLKLESESQNGDVLVPN